MGIKHYKKNLERISKCKFSYVDADFITQKLAKREAKVNRNLHRETVYLTIMQEALVKQYSAYENRKLVKTGERESCKQRKRRLRKEYLASKNK